MTKRASSVCDGDALIQRAFMLLFLSAFSGIFFGTVLSGNGTDVRQVRLPRRDVTVECVTWKRIFIGGVACDFAHARPVK